MNVVSGGVSVVGESVVVSEAVVVERVVVVDPKHSSSDGFGGPLFKIDLFNISFQMGWIN